MSRHGFLQSVLLSGLLVCAPGLLAAEAGNGDSAPDWARAMRQVHARFTGEKGTFAHFGDSITVTLAFWTPLLYARDNASSEMQQAYDTVKAYMKTECWRQWKGSEYGNEGGQTIRWAHANVARWLQRLNPEVALIMFGTNDLHAVPLDEYRDKLRRVVQRCLDNGTVVILSTIPPRHGLDQKAADYAEAIRATARAMHLPLIDFHAEILRRRPDDWDGATETFAAYDGYEVPTLLARDGIHPSNPKDYQDDYSPEGLAHSGYVLRNYLTLMKYAEVIQVLRADGTDDAAIVCAPSTNEPSVADLIGQTWFPKAPPLGAPRGSITRVCDAGQLIQAINAAQPGQTILLEDGHYWMPHYVILRTDGVTLRSASGDRRRVIIDGARSRDGELIGLSACRGVTIADLTIQNIRWNGFKINSETNVQDLTIHNCVIHNIWQRGVKGVKVPPDHRDMIRPRNCRIQYCLFYNDRAKRFSDDPADTPANFNGDYIGGIDVMYPSNWTIRDNVFIGIQGRTRQGRGAIFLWHDARDCIVERNIIIDCDAGICLGNPHRPNDIRDHCTACVVRNNFVTRAPQAGIVTVYTRDCRLLNNTIYDPDNRLERLIRVVFANDGLLIGNNLLCGAPPRIESDSPIRQVTNLAQDLGSDLVDPERGNLHLAGPAAGVIDGGTPFPEVVEDMDRQPRTGRPDIGADEYLP